MTNQDLISGLFDASIYVVPLLIGGLLWFFGWLRRPEGHTMKWTGVVLVVLFGLPAVNRLIFYVRTDDRFAIDPDDAVVVAVYVGAGVALAIVIPLAIHVGKRIGRASVQRSIAPSAGPPPRSQADGQGGIAEPVRRQGPSTMKVLTLSLLGIAGFLGLVLVGFRLVDADGSSALAAPPTTTASPTTSSTTTSAPPAQVPVGFEMHDGSADGFTIALPSRWVSLDLMSEDLDAMVDEMGEFGPETVDLFREAVASGDFAGFALFALDAGDGDPSVNLTVFPAGPLDRLETIEAVLPAQMEELYGATVLSIERTSVAGTEGLLMVAETPTVDGVAEQHQYIVLTEDRVYNIVFTSYNPAKDRETFAAMMETFRPVGD